MKKPKTTHTSMDLEAALIFIKTFHPELCCRMDEEDIILLLDISHSLFVTRPHLLDPSADHWGQTPTQ